jgi:hypothetical protein
MILGFVQKNQIQNMDTFLVNALHFQIVPTEDGIREHLMNLRQQEIALRPAFLASVEVPNSPQKTSLFFQIIEQIDLNQVNLASLLVFTRFQAQYLSDSLAGSFFILSRRILLSISKDFAKFIIHDCKSF